MSCRSRFLTCRKFAAKSKELHGRLAREAAELHLQVGYGKTQSFASLPDSLRLTLRAGKLGLLK